MRVTNIDTLSAYLDRLVTERIKMFFFQKDGANDKVNHQQEIINEIKQKIVELFTECDHSNYVYVGEQRTFLANQIVEQIEQLVTNDIHIGESDRARLAVVLSEEKRLRKSNEGRAQNKNTIDSLFEQLAHKRGKR